MIDFLLNFFAIVIIQEKNIILQVMIYMIYLMDV